MTTLTDRIAAHSRRPTATVYLGGKRWRSVLSLSRAQQYGQCISGGEVVGRDPPVTIAEGETRISWSWGYDGHEIAGFAGIVAKILQKSYPNQWSLQVADPLWLADIRRKDYTASPINDCPASDAVEQFLGSAGLTRLSIPALAASGSAWAGDEWTLGTLTPVAFANTTALQASVQVCQTLGYWLYCDAAGVARATLLERRPSDSPFRTLRWGTDFLLAGPPERERDAAQVKNRIVVRGANTGYGGAQIQDAWQTGAADRTLEVTYALIEYVNESEAGAASCTGAAKRLLRLWDRDPNVIRIPRLKADPRLGVGQTVAIECAPIGYSSARPFFIYALETRLDLRKGDFSQSLTLDGGVGDQGYTTLPAPEASFSWRLARETLDGTGVVEVFLDGTGSHSLGDGEIVSYAWSTATPVASGYASTATGPKAMFVYPAATTSADITLTVTDTSSKTGSITQTVPLAGDETTSVTTRTIVIPLGSAVAVTPDGGATWRVDTTGDAILTPESNGDTLITTSGTGGTALRTSADGGATWAAGAPLGGGATAMDRTAGLERLWIAAGAELYLSLDKGATKTHWGTLPAPISAVLEDPAVLNSVFVLAGANMYHSTLDTPGSTGWVVLYAGPAGATARHLVRGPSGATTWIAYTGSFIGSPLQRVEGPIAALFPLGSTVAEIRALALSPDELQVFCWDSEGNGWTVDSATGVAVANAATLPAGVTAQHALHDPDESIVYLATFGATAGTTYKYLSLADKLAAFYVPASGQQAHRVGIGGPPAPMPGNIIVPTWGVTGANDGVWFHSAGGWTKKAPPVAGAFWASYTANPFDDAEGILIGNSVARNDYGYSDGAPLRMADGTHSPLWHTSDGGATWAPIDISPPSLVAPHLNTHLVDAAWGAAGGWAVGGYLRSFAIRSRAVVWRAGGVATNNAADHEGLAAIAPGQDGEMIVAHEWGDGISSVTVAGAWSPAQLAPDGANAIGVASPLLGRVAYIVLPDGSLLRTSDYRSGALAPVSGAPSDVFSVAVVADGDAYMIRGDGGPGLIVSRLVGGASADLDHAASVSNAWPPLVTNRSRSALAWAWRYHGFRSYDGSAWTTIPFPAGLDQPDLGRFAITEGAASS